MMVHIKIWPVLPFPAYFLFNSFLHKNTDNYNNYNKNHLENIDESEDQR
ncbi:MAG: hypothetical protein ACFE9I_16175 [Candidatus Hermodarchaeota archaeon]